MTLTRTLGALLSVVLALPSPAIAQRPLNLDFETPSVAYADRPWGWALGWSAWAAGPGARFTLDSTRVLRGVRSLRLTAADTAPGTAPRALALQLPAAFARGRALRLTGWTRTSATEAHSLVTLEAWGDRVVAAADSADAGDAQRAGADGWSQVSLTIAVPADTSIHSIVISVAVQGTGTAWFDALELFRDGERLESLPAEAPPPTRAELAYLAGRSAPLLRAEIGAAGPGRDDDLASIARIVGDARIVGLGESTHGTREFFQLKHRIVEFLVRTQGFDVFAVEANQLAVERINAYVLGGPGTAREVMRAMFRVWNTEEMLALVDWMRAYNAAHPERPVHFIGYDLQDQRGPADTLLAFVTRADTALVSRVGALTQEYRSVTNAAAPQVAAETRARWKAQGDSLVRDIGARRAPWLADARTRADSVRVEWASHSAELFRQAATLNASLSSPDRDSLMAANLDWALRTLHPGSRAVVWAHDVHVSHGGDPVRSFNGGAQMGAHLKRSYGHTYRAFSLLTRTGAYSATRSFTDHAIFAAEAFPAPEGSVEALLAAVPRSPLSIGLVADLRVGERDAQGAWLWRPRPLRHVGYAAYDYAFELRAVMPLEFDGVILIERTTPSRPLP